MLAAATPQLMQSVRDSGTALNSVSSFCVLCAIFFTKDIDERCCFYAEMLKRCIFDCFNMQE